MLKHKTKKCKNEVHPRKGAFYKDPFKVSEYKRQKTLISNFLRHSVLINNKTIKFISLKNSIRKELLRVETHDVLQKKFHFLKTFFEIASFTGLTGLKMLVMDSGRKIILKKEIKNKQRVAAFIFAVMKFEIKF